jgi:hypothetical protein
MTLPVVQFSWHVYGEEGEKGGGFIRRKTSTREAVIGEMLCEQILNFIWKY